MISRGPWQEVDRSQWRGRRKNARDFLQAARDLRDLSDDDDNGNPVMSQALLAVIAFSDALTIKVAGIQNTGDHRTATITEAAGFVEQAERFARWAEKELVRL